MSDLSKNVVDINYSYQMSEFQNGKETGENARIQQIEDQFSWKRSFINCWTGSPNSGKTTLLNFLAVLKSKHDDWKWCVWSPEMINSFRHKGRVSVSYSDLIDELIHTYTGLNPYVHFAKKYNLLQMSKDVYEEAIGWVKDHFHFVYPADKNYKSIRDSFLYIYEMHGVDGFILDPFKNMRLSGTESARSDEMLHEIFDEYKHLSVITNTTVNIVTHPRSRQDYLTEGDEKKYKIVTQHDLLGGSAWNNSMDGIFSVYRPWLHEDSNDRRVWLWHLKQRKKHLVGQTGVYKNIEFDWRTNRYHFDGYCPIDNSYMDPMPVDTFYSSQFGKTASQNGNYGNIHFQEVERKDKDLIDNNQHKLLF